MGAKLGDRRRNRGETGCFRGQHFQKVAKDVEPEASEGLMVTAGGCVRAALHDVVGRDPFSQLVERRCVSVRPPGSIEAAGDVPSGNGDVRRMRKLARRQSAAFESID